MMWAGQGREWGREGTYGLLLVSPAATPPLRCIFCCLPENTRMRESLRRMDNVGRELLVERKKRVAISTVAWFF